MIAVPRLIAPLLGLALILLGGCMLMPGRFVSELDLRQDGRFAFTYKGEIHLLALSRMMEQGRPAPREFEKSPCLSEETGEERPCTKAEADEQKTQWQAQRDDADASRKRDNEQMKAMLGGIDPGDPRAAEEFAQRLRRQAGWKRVDYKGDGLFDVDFAISGTLSHDFRFPSIERFPIDNAFVQLALRADNTVRIDAPGFGPASGGEPMRNMAQLATLRAGDGMNTPKMPELDGTFTLRTDGAVLANNTEEGPQADTTGQRLSWTVNLRSTAAPMALVRLGR